MAEQGSKKKRKGRRAYLEDYVSLGDGSYAYTGKVYSYSGSLSWKNTLVRLWALGGGSALCAAVCGLLPASGMLNSFYVLLPWLLSFAGAASLIWALCRMAQNGPELKEYIYKATVEALPLRTVFTAVCCGVTLIGYAVSLFFVRDPQHLLEDICYPILMAASGVLALLLRKTARHLTFEGAGGDQAKAKETAPKTIPETTGTDSES